MIVYSYYSLNDHWPAWCTFQDDHAQTVRSGTNSSDCFHFSRTYNQLWAEAQSELSCLLEEELPAEPRRPEKDRVVFFQRLAMLFVRYTQVFRQLENAYDLVVHPQKRRFIHSALESVMGRVLELKNEMVEKEFSEYHYMDDVLHDLKLIPVRLSSR